MFFCIIFAVVILIFMIEKKYSPRIDVTKERDVLLWYNNKYNNRYFIKLFKI